MPCLSRRCTHALEYIPLNETPQQAVLRTKPEVLDNIMQFIGDNHNLPVSSVSTHMRDAYAGAYPDERITSMDTAVASPQMLAFASPPPSFNPLDAAARTGNVAMVQHLMQQGVLPTLATYEGAARGGHIAVLEALPLANPPSNTILEAAASAGHVDVVEWLEERDCDYDFHDFIGAACNGDIAMLQWLTQNNPPIMLQGLATFVDRAARHQHIPLLEFLPLSAALAPTAFTAATEGGHVAVLEWLVQRFAIPINAELEQLGVKSSIHWASACITVVVFTARLPSCSAHHASCSQGGAIGDAEVVERAWMSLGCLRVHTGYFR